MSNTSTTSNPRVTRPSADATRERIVAAAVDLFSERSFDGATTRDIATRAAVAQPLLHYHFHSKEALWQAAVDSLFDLLNQAMDERASGLRGVDEITRAKLIVREFITFSARNPQLHRIIMQESKADGPRMDYLVDQHVRPIYERTIEIFESLSRWEPCRTSRRRTSTTSSPGPVRRCSCSRQSADDSAPSIRPLTGSSKPTPTRSAGSCSAAPDRQRRVQRLSAAAECSARDCAHRTSPLPGQWKGRGPRERWDVGALRVGTERLAWRSRTFVTYVSHFAVTRRSTVEVSSCPPSGDSGRRRWPP